MAGKPAHWRGQLQLTWPARRSRKAADSLRRSFDVVVAWAIDRLGRSLIDLLGTIQTLEASGVDLYLDQQSIDTTTPAGKLMFQVWARSPSLSSSMIRQRIHAGLKRAVAQGKQLGRPRGSVPRSKSASRLNCAPAKACNVARECGAGGGTVQRIKKEMKGPFVGVAA